MAKMKQQRGEVKNPTGERLRGALKFVEERLKLSGVLISATPFSDEWATWRLATFGGVKDLFGEGSDEYLWIKPSPQLPIVTTSHTPPDYVAQKEAESYDKQLRGIRNGLSAILEKYAALGPLPDQQEDRGVRPATATRGFISHGGFKPSLQGVQDFLRALGIEPVVVERQASEGREVHGNVDKYRDDCHFAIVLWTKDVEDAAGGWLPSGSVMMEAGELRMQFRNRVIFLKDEGVGLPAMGGTLVFEQFTEEDLAPIFRKIVTELHGWGWLKVQPLEPSTSVYPPETPTSEMGNEIISGTEDGIWDWLEGVELSIAGATEQILEMGQLFQDMGTKLSERTETMKERSSSGNAKPSEMRVLLSRAAGDMLDFTKAFHDRTETYHDHWQRFDQNVIAFLSSPQARSQDRAGLAAARDNVQGIIPAADDALPSFESLADQVRSLRRSGLVAT